jgi:hypothetical protein
MFFRSNVIGQARRTITMPVHDRNRSDFTSKLVILSHGHSCAVLWAFCIVVQSVWRSVSCVLPSEVILLLLECVTQPDLHLDAPCRDEYNSFTSKLVILSPGYSCACFILSSSVSVSDMFLCC